MTAKVAHVVVVGLALAGCKRERAEPASAPACARSGFAVHAVDDGSPYMRTLFADGSTTTGTVTADTDFWLDGDGRSHRDYYLAAADRATLERAVGELVSHRAVPSDRRIVVEHPDPPRHTGWRTYYVVAEPMLDASAIASVEAGDNAVSGLFVGLTLTPEGRGRFAAVTRANIGKKLAVVLDGTVVQAAVISTTIDGGRLAIDIAREADPKATQRALVAKLGCP